MRAPILGPWLWLLALVVAGLPTPAAAQYFGTNKVQYKTFQFQVLETEHFDIYFYPSERAGADLSARLAERWYARLRDVFAYELEGRQPLVLYASHVDFQQTNIVSGEVGEGTGGLTEPIRRRIVLPLAGPLADTDHVLGHELVHAFQYDMTSRRNAPESGGALEQLPLWFVEGMAEYLSLGPVDPHTSMWLRDAARAEKVPRIRDLGDSEYFPYRWGHAFWAYVCGRWGDEVIPHMLLAASVTGSPAQAIQAVLGVTEEELSAGWQTAVRETYAPVLAATSPPSGIGTPVIRPGGGLGGAINVGPAISPDGRWIAFLSERSVFSIDLFVADAATGAVSRKLTDTASDPHYSSLQFIYSAGAWDRSSRHLAVATVVRGRAALSVFEWPSGVRQFDRVIDGVDEILNPTWSPDGRSIGFTGLSGGLTDLFLFDLGTSTLRRLTNDPFADLQPAWSPDGRRIAFVTDRFSTDLGTLAVGAYRLALLDPQTGSIEAVPGFPNGKHISPQWSPDGRSLYFVADRDGISNLYRVQLDNGALSQLTTIATGISGITASSPVLSVAAEAGLATLTVYDEGKYALHTLRLESGTAPAAGQPGASTLPPVGRKASYVGTLLANAGYGLPEPTSYPVSDYRSRLSLDSVGQTMIAIGVDRFGAAFGAGLGISFSDMLNTHRLATIVQFNSGLTGGLSLRDTAAQAAYVNQERRWNWGVLGGQIPYLSGFATIGTGLYQGEPVQVEQVLIYRQTERSLSGLVAYPFNRARRLELQGGVTNVSFTQTVRTDAYSFRTGDRVFTDTEEVTLADALTVGTASAAFVSDTSQFGATSPVRGERYRMEVAPAFGSINFASLLGDYRRYVMPVSFYTVAARVLHYGRYGSGSEDVRLVPLYLGYPTLVRGYDVNSFDASECVATPASECPVFERLLGSRMLVGNLELRFPLLRPFGASSRMYGPLPVEVALFSDAGVAWGRGERPSVLGGEREGVTSAGVTLRVNLMGFAVGQLDIVRPFRRPAAGWVFGFTLAPGF